MYLILVAEDEPINQLAVSELIRRGADGQLEVLLAGNSREAIRLLEEKQRGERVSPDETAGQLRLREVRGMIRDFVEEHYREDIAVQDAARAMNYSDAYFCKVFKQCFGRSFVSYLTSFRVEKARELLADVRINIKDISKQVGYHDSSYFARVFKRLAGVTPSEYRAEVLRKKGTNRGKAEP